MLDRFLRHGTLSTALAITCLGPCVLQAQTAADRPSLARLRCELDSATTVAQVDRVSAGWDATAPRPVEPLGDAYIQLRRAVLAGKRGSFVSAWDDFDQAVRLHPEWPYARLGLALTALEIYIRRYPLPASYDNVASGTHYDGYTLQLTRTLRTEPGFQPAIDWVVASMDAEGDYQHPSAVVDALRFIADSTDVSDPRIELLLARSDRLRGHPTQSLQRIRYYLSEGGDSGVALLEQARSFAWMGSLDSAAVLYLRGAQVQTAAVRQAYRSDIDWVASTHQLAQFDDLSSDSVGLFVATFWGSRLSEHLNRWVYVSQNFALPDPSYRAQFLPYGTMSCQQGADRSPADNSRAARQLVDSRAVLYARFGAALRRQVNGVALRTSTGDGNPALAYRYDAGLMSGSNVASNGSATSLPVSPVSARTQLAPFMPTSVAPIPFDRDISWVYVVDGQVHEAVPGSCPH